MLSYGSDSFNGIILQRGYPSFAESSSVYFQNIEAPHPCDELTFEFRIELLPPYRYGNLFHIFSNEKSLLSIVYSTSRVIEKQGFIMSIPEHNFSKALHYQPQNSLGKKIDLSVSINKTETTFEINNDSVGIVFDGSIELPDDFNIYFGATPSKKEGINLILERFKINYSTSSKTDSLKWSFDKFTDNKTYDNTEKYEAKFINAKPKVVAHFNWESLGDINIPSSGSIYIDETKSVFYTLTSNSLFTFDFRKNYLSEYKLQSSIPYEQNSIFKNSFSDELLLTWSGGQGDISVWDSSSATWSQTRDRELSTDYFGSALFVSPVDSAIYSLGGYGNYMFKNVLQKFNPDNAVWEIIPTSEDIFPPSKPFVIENFSDSTVLALPIIGSDSGDQTMESKPFSNLYELNLKNYEFRKIANLFDLKHNQAIESIVWADKHDELYFLLVTTNDTAETAQVYNYDFELDSSFAVAEPFLSKLRNEQNIYYSSNTDELLLFEYNPAAKKTIHSISKIFLPILSRAEVKKYINMSVDNKNYTIFYTLASLVIVLFLLWFFVIKKNRKKLVFYKTPPIKNSISLLGGFSIYDKSGGNIESYFSTKILEAFLLIFIKSFSMNNLSSGNGVSSVELSNSLWPDFDKDSQKNNRNVTINKVRHLLKDVNGLQIVYENSRWKIRLNKEMFVDLFQFTKILEEKNKDGFISFINNYKIGEAFKNISYEWLDPLKVTLNRFLIDSILVIYKENKSSFSTAEIFQIGKSILEIDELSEAGIGLVIRSQKMKGSINGFHREYELFKKKYFDLTGENFDKSAKELEKNEI